MQKFLFVPDVSSKKGLNLLLPYRKSWLKTTLLAPGVSKIVAADFKIKRKSQLKQKCPLFGMDPPTDLNYL